MQDQNTQQQDPMATLVAQVKMLDDNVSAMMGSGTKSSEIIEDYICPILHAMVVAIEQGFTGLNQVAQTASIALVTSERTLAGETLNAVANGLMDADEMCADFAESLTEDQKANFAKIQDLLTESLDLVLAWSGDDDDSDDDLSGDDDSDDDLSGDDNNSDDSEDSDSTEVEVVESDD